MKTNYVPSDLIYRKDEIAAINQEIDALVETFEPAAKDVLESALSRQTVDAAVEDMMSEAVQTLAPLLLDAKSQSLVDGESRKLREKLAADLKKSFQPAKIDDDWLRAKVLDLARVVATYWFGLGKTNSERFARAMTVLSDLIHESSASAAAQDFRLACQSFGLNEDEQAALLVDVSMRVRERTRQQPTAIEGRLSLWQRVLEVFQPSGRDALAHTRRPHAVLLHAFTAVYVRADIGFVGFIEELPGVNSHGRTLDEAKRALMRLSSSVFEHEKSMEQGMMPALERHEVQQLAMEMITGKIARIKKDEVARESVRLSFG